jgi:hypothetical protein
MTLHAGCVGHAALVFVLLGSRFPAEQNVEFSASADAHDALIEPLALLLPQMCTPERELAGKRVQ